MYTDVPELHVISPTDLMMNNIHDKERIRRLFFAENNYAIVAAYFANLNAGEENKC